MIYAIGLIFITFLFYQFPPSFIEINGCTDAQMYNYDRRANVDDGSCIPIVRGCTWPEASNFDGDANTMKNYSCVLVDSATCRNRTRRIRVDLEEYSEIKLEFVQNCRVAWDTLYDRGVGAWITRKSILLPDTSVYESLVDGSYAKVPADTDFGVKVIETIPGFDTREYRIHVKGYGGSYLINPGCFHSYVIERHVYGSSAWGLSHRPLTYEMTGFLIESGHDIHWWFEEAPSQITVETTYGRTFDDYKRYNIIRQ